MDNKKLISIIIALVLVAGGVGFWYWSKSNQGSSSSSQETPTLGGQISEKLQNPLGGKLPETNPFKDQKNPFDVIYNNPFK